MIPPSRAHPWAEPPPATSARDDAADSDPVTEFVRPFIVTGGRTTPLLDGLRIETLVQASPAALSAPLRFEERSAVQLCQRPHSIAEIAVALGVPIGVAKVVVGDLVTAGHASVREADELQIAAIERIRDLVKAL